MLAKIGKETHIVIGTIIIITPTIIKGALFDIIGYLISFKNNFTASANGTISPIGPGLLGPFRIWMYPRTFRSIKVKNATEIITSTKMIILSIFNS